MIKSILKTVWKFLYKILIMIVLGVLLMTLAYMLPIDAIQRNMGPTAKTIEDEGDFPQIYSWCLSRVDSFTDGLMLLEASTPNVESAMKSAMMSNRYLHGDDIPSDVIIKIYGDEHTVPTGTSAYFRYWHGYLTVLKPLLTITDYAHIRIINFIVQSLLTIIISIVLWIKNYRRYILPFIISLLCIAPQMSAICMQYSTCYYILLGGSIIILLKGDKASNMKLYFLFLYIGCATSFFDFLTYPITTFGIPCVFYLNSRDEDCNVVSECFTVIKSFFSWLAGYGIMWLGKFLAGWIITGNNIAMDAFNEALYWKEQNNYVENELGVNVFKVFYRELRSFSMNPAVILAIVFALYSFVLIVKKYKSDKTNTLYILKYATPYLIVAVFPFVWYAALISPSWEHDFFTYKSLVVTVFAGLSMLIKIFENLKETCR